MWYKLGDSLSWSRGHAGCGYLLHDGTIKTWNVDPYNPLDHHDVQQLNNELSPIALKFEIDPDGGVVTEEPTTKVEAIVAEDPRLYDAGQRPDFIKEFNLDQVKPNEESIEGPDYNFVMSGWAGWDEEHYGAIEGLPDPVRTNEFDVERLALELQNRGFSWEEALELAQRKQQNPLPGHGEGLSLQGYPKQWQYNTQEWGDLGTPHYGGSWDPTICESCGKPMTSPRQLGNGWVNNCTSCGLTRDVPSSTPLLRQEQENWPSYPDLLNQVGKPRAWIAKSRYTHRNRWTGRLCDCAWGHPRLRRTAGVELRRLMKSPDKAWRTPEGQAFLERLYQLPEEYDSLFPYLAQRFKKGDVRLIGDQLEYHSPDGFREWLPVSGALPIWHQWYEARQHPSRRGVNIMDPKFTPTELNARAHQHQEALREAQAKQYWLSEYGYAQPAHTFGPEAGGFKGWQVVPLDEHQAEGDSRALGHCIGSPEYSYHHNIASGNIDAFSLRDKEGYPHVSWHVNPSGDGIGHMQGKSGRPNEEYRRLISMFNEAHGLSDEEPGEEPLEPAYDEYFTFPSAWTVQEYVEYHHPEYYYEYAHDHGNIGDDTQFDWDSPYWDRIADDYLDGAPDDGFMEALRHQGTEPDMYEALHRNMDPSNEDHRDAIRNWNHSAGYQYEIEVPYNANEVDQYNAAVSDAVSPEPTDWSELAQDYLDHPTVYEGGEYPAFHENLRDHGHEDTMAQSLGRNIDWEDELHQQAIGNWNNAFPTNNIYQPAEPPPPQNPEQMSWDWSGQQLPPFPTQEQNNRWISNWHFADYEGWPNWETWNTALMMDNEEPIYRRTRQMIERGVSVDQLRDYLIQSVVGPYNKERIEDAKEWNETPYEERRDPHFEDLMRDSPQAADFVMGIGDVFSDEEGKNPFGPDIEDTEPELIDPELVDWQNIWDHLYDEIEGNNEYDRENERLRGQGLTFHMPGHSDETNQMLDAWLKHHGVTEKDQRLPNGGSAEHHTKMQVPIEHLPMNEGNYLPEAYAQWQQQGYGEPRVREWGWDTLWDIQKGRANPWQQQRMQEALAGQGYTPEQIAQIIRQQLELDETGNNWNRINQTPPVSQDQPGDTYLPEGWTSKTAVSPATELREWLGDISQEDPLPSIHHDDESQMALSPNVSPSEAPPYYPPGHAPDQYKQGGQGLSKSAATKTADSPITQADATNDPLGKNPAIIPERKGDPEFIKMEVCPSCQQPHKPDEPCPDSAVRQYKQQERQWYRRDPNAIHSQPDGLTDQQSDLGKTANPDTHRLWFEPNRPGQGWGRGIYHKPSQTLHTWPEPEATHVQRVDQIWPTGVDPQTISCLYISPEGLVHPDDALAPEHAQTIEQADPRLRVVNPGSREGRTAANQVMYHVAPAEYGREIAAKGLQPNTPGEGYPQGVYLFPDLDNAHFFADTMREQALDEGWDPDHHVYEVNVGDLPLQDDPAVTSDDPYQAEYPNPLRSYYTAQPISPERIRRIAKVSALTGDEQLDALLEQYRQQHWEGAQSVSPEEVEGMCTAYAHELAKFLQTNGVQAQVRYVEHPSELGYTDRTRVPDLDEGHAVVDAGRHTIDFSAAQYGYSQFPMILVDGKRIAKVAAMTLPQEQREWQYLTEASEENPKVTVQHQFPDGWSIHRLDNDAAVQRAGKFMRNCWQGGRVVPSEFAANPEAAEFSPSRHHVLNDEHGLPRAAFFHQPSRGAIDNVLGARNGRPDDEHLLRLQQWLPLSDHYRHILPHLHEAYPGYQQWDWDERQAKTAALKERYAEALSQPGHQLWYKPNPRVPHTWGRGLVHEPSMTVHTWPETEATHNEMAYAKGFEPRQCCQFLVNPSGVVTTVYGPSSMLETIHQADPSLS